MSFFFQELVNGVTTGALYALIALGFSMVYGVLKLLNFAHGDLNGGKFFLFKIDSAGKYKLIPSS